MGFWRKIFAGGKGHEEKRHNFDSGLRYCPTCAIEYRPEISHCAACGLALISGEERIAAWQKSRDERAHAGREIAAGDRRYLPGLWRSGANRPAAMPGLRHQLGLSRLLTGAFISGHNPHP